MTQIFTFLLMFSSLTAPSHVSCHRLPDTDKKICEEVVKEEDEPPLLPESVYDWFEMANLPEIWWDDFAEVAACESSYYPFAEGDGGKAKGLFQIHWNVLWADWANTNWVMWKPYGIEHDIISIDDWNDRYDPISDKFYYFGHDEWSDPIKNIQLAWIINVFYDMRRTGVMWNQWPGHPYIGQCEAKRDILDANGWMQQYVNTD